MEILIHRSSTMATMVKPKERQFQVVPVPAIFTRGRWECRDFKESSNFAVLSNAGGNCNTENIQIFEFQSQSHHMHSDVPSTIPLMRHDVKNMVATSIVLPEILPGVDTSMISNVGSIVGTGFVSQVTIMESDANRDGSASSGAVATTNQNSVAIDNKIEQAMDLVKTHLTFAVREEVEQLRTQISDLESKVNNLESENQILRQFTPAEVVANLPLLLQQHKAQSSTASTNVDALGTLHISQSQSVQVLQHPTPPQYSSATIPSVSSAPILGNVVSQPSSAQVNVGQPQMQQQTITQKQSILPKTRSPTPTTSIGKVSAQTDGNATQHQ